MVVGLLRRFVLFATFVVLNVVIAVVVNSIDEAREIERRRAITASRPRGGSRRAPAAELFQRVEVAALGARRAGAAS